ncbi:hypothetical protein KIPE111705_16155 [Kibdelosporangium persicum]|uniref:Uncharacterized protein n=1 Tax=Kibdelosporangium persicum TaxID=2698649 RepID=A0ABX2EY05_9PSEU|nr:hypothetical protein [Kibdelosporangium persicum]NRN63921.1 hypothetical protein [Kibdelosporangium persicum]
MDELEHRLRSALTELAEEVPPSHGAWEEQQRRLALKSRRDRRRPAVMAAVAAAVVALIAVPVVIINQQVSSPVDPAGSLPLVTNPPESSRAQVSKSRVQYVPLKGESLVTEPAIVGSQYFTNDRTMLLTYAYTVRMPDGDWQLCRAQNMEGQPINGPQQTTFGTPSCQPLHQPKDGKFFWGRREMSSPGAPGTWVYVMSHPADNLMLARADDSLLMAQSKAVGKDFVLFVAYVGSPKPPIRWTVRDASNQTLQDG